ncbi:YhgE/Pip domain-containing protein [Bacillus testis]|uniref:YhgE/Pip domain-containing protein n=1 Tax=Bacillus testis TaxID=1622072 RepID=UPI00067EBCB7|nr:ABC transporter permease [Bacillus testis]
MGFLKFLKNKGVIAAIFMAIFYQIIMMGSFMPGYSAIPKNMDDLHAAIVNDDTQYGKQIAKQLKESLPFKEIATDKSLKESKKMLDDRDIHLVVHIPKDFSANLQSGKAQPDIDFYVNEANPAMVSSTMQFIVKEIDSKMSEQFSINKAKGIFATLNVPEKQADAMAKSIENSFDANLISINKVPQGLHNQMAPFFLTMVSYVGAMIASLMLVGVFNGMKNILGKWRTYAYIQIVSVILSVVAPLIGIAIVYIMHGYGTETFFQLWVNHALQLFVSLQFTLIFSFLFGQGGMLINLPLLLIQTIAAGAVMTREVMFGFFRAVSYISPMYYSVQADFTTMFGGGHLAEYLGQLALIGVVALAINTLAVAFGHKDNALPRPLDNSVEKNA